MLRHFKIGQSDELFSNIPFDFTNRFQKFETLLHGSEFNFLSFSRYKNRFNASRFPANGFLIRRREMRFHFSREISRDREELSLQPFNAVYVWTRDYMRTITLDRGGALATPPHWIGYTNSSKYDKIPPRRCPHCHISPKHNSIRSPR